MRKILITGKSSYIGQTLKTYLEQDKWNGAYEVHMVSLREKELSQIDLAGYDVLVHAAGIAHVDTDGASDATKALYYKVNRDLTLTTACAAKEAGVQQFLYLSSMIVYGDSAPMGRSRVIDHKTMPRPVNFYGDSKLQAEQKIQPLADSDYTITIVRPPMVYGKSSKGNYPRLSKMARTIPFFPNITNHRSMIFIDNLCEMMRLLIDQNRGGIYCPQNKEPVVTAQLVKKIAQTRKKAMILVPGLSPLLHAMSHITGYIDKIFGNMSYSTEFSTYDSLPYQIVDFEESIRKTEDIK